MTEQPWTWKDEAWVLWHVTLDMLRWLFVDHLGYSFALVLSALFIYSMLTWTPSPSPWQSLGGGLEAMTTDEHTTCYRWSGQLSCVVDH